MQFSIILLALPLASASVLVRAPSATTLPAATGTLVLTQGTSIPAGTTFDGKMKRVDNGRACELDVDYGNGDIVFTLGEGATLKNVIIGPNQKKGVHCLGKCTLINVWWQKVCYDGLSITVQKAGDKTVVRGGGAFSSGASFIQHAGSGSVEVSDFAVDGFETFYKSSGTYSTAPGPMRSATLTGLIAKNGKHLAGINSNAGDTATIKSSTLTKVTNVCTKYKSVAKGGSAVLVGSGADGKNCIYGSDVIVN